jgi:hypothetical protein
MKMICYLFSSGRKPRCLSAANGDSIIGHSSEKVYSVSVMQVDVLPPMLQLVPCKGTSQNRGSYDVMLSCVSGFCCCRGMCCCILKCH